MSWLDEVKNYGPYVAEKKFCEKFLELYQLYEVIITGNEGYQRLTMVRDKSLVDMRLKVANNELTEAEYEQIVNYFKTEIEKLIIQIESEPITKETVKTSKLMINRMMNKTENKNICNRVGINIPDQTTLYPFDTYQHLAQQVKMVLGKVEVFMNSLKK